MWHPPTSSWICLWSVAGGAQIVLISSFAIFHLPNTQKTHNLQYCYFIFQMSYKTSNKVSLLKTSFIANTCNLCVIVTNGNFVKIIQRAEKKTSFTHWLGELAVFVDVVGFCVAVVLFKMKVITK